jgi:transcriptional regulator with PAS, ATPase and Fis domain
MKFQEFKKSPTLDILDRSETAWFALDSSDRFLWISRKFAELTKYSQVELLKKKLTEMIDVINETDRGKSCRIKPKSSVAYGSFFPDLSMDSPEREGAHVLINPARSFDDFTLYSLNYRFYSVERYHLYYEKDLFAILDDDLRFEEFGNRLYYKLLRFFGNREFRNVSLRDFIMKKDFEEWEKSRNAFYKYVEEQSEKSTGPSEMEFDSGRQNWEQLFNFRNRDWKVQDKSVSLVRKNALEDANYLISRRTFDFFKRDYKIEYSTTDARAGITLCGLENPFLTPDESGYLVNFHAGHAQLKRNSNTVSMRPFQDGPVKVCVEKTGPVLAVQVDGKAFLHYIDEIPFYSDYERLNRFCLNSGQPITFTNLRISSRPSVFNYEKMGEFRKLVRFKNDSKNFYEMQIIPGAYVSRMKKFLILRELTEVIMAEERMSSYKKDRDQALMQLASTEQGFHGLIGTSPVLENIVSIIRTVGKTNASVLITGETGTGKDLAARAIHEESGRKGPFIKLDCASLPVTLIESELFGHEKGAFTGADQVKIGKFELADKGTLFLDEIGNLSLELQMKLLRFLQDRQFERLGGKKTLSSDVRVLAATNINLEEAVNQGKFRADLYYRIKVVHIEMPLLRDRLMDIYPIVNHLIVNLAQQNEIPLPRIHNNVFPALMNYDWPGNVRELKNAIENVLVIHREKLITVDHFPALLKKRGAVTGPDRTAAAPRENEYKDKEKFTRAFERLQGSPKELALYFGCSYHTIRRYISHYGLESSVESKIEQVLDKFGDNEFSLQEFMDELKVSRTTAIKYLADLVKRKSLQRRAADRKYFYKQI